MTTSGDTQALPRIPVPGVPTGQPLPTVALAMAPFGGPSVGARPAPRPPVQQVPVQQDGAHEPDVPAEDDDAPFADAEIVEPEAEIVEPEVEAEVDQAETPPAVAEGTPAKESAMAPPDGAPASSVEAIYEEAMATIAALAESWAETMQRTAGRHRPAA